MDVHNTLEDSDWKVTLAEYRRKHHDWRAPVASEKYLEGEEQFCLTYGDGLSDINIREKYRIP